MAIFVYQSAKNNKLGKNEVEYLLPVKFHKILLSAFWEKFEKCEMLTSDGRWQRIIKNVSFNFRI